MHGREGSRKSHQNIPGLSDARIGEKSCEALLHKSRDISNAHCYDRYYGKRRVEIYIESRNPYDEDSKGGGERCHLRASGQERTDRRRSAFESIRYPHVKWDDSHFRSETDDE